MKHKPQPHYPLIILYARDWAARDSLLKVSDAKNIPLPTAWIAGWLITERKDCYVVAHQNFDDEGDEVRETTVIPKENVSFKRIIPIESITMGEK